MPPLPTTGPLSLADRVAGALWGVLIADALAMPVHWYYDVNALKRDFGTITDYQKPKAKHPSSIMNLSNTGGHGRGGQSGTIIGDVINHGKHKYWNQPQMHYHQGMAAGGNTLNALCARVVTRSVSRNGGYSSTKFLEDYVKFMTTPGTHNDTYAESFHRDFFANWAKGIPPERCSKGTEGHNTASIGGFVMLPPVTLSFLQQGWQQAKQATLLQLGLTHESARLASYAEVYAKLLYDVTKGADLRSSVQIAAKAVGLDLVRTLQSGLTDTQVVHQYGSACYITSSLPVVLYLAYRHAESFEDAVLANVNAGGENAHRGAALGALMGAAHGKTGIPERFITGLHDSAAISHEINDFIRVVLGSEENGTRQEL